MSPSLPLLPINKRNQLNTSFDLCAAAVYEDVQKLLADWSVKAPVSSTCLKWDTLLAKLSIRYRRYEDQFRYFQSSIRPQLFHGYQLSKITDVCEGFNYRGHLQVPLQYLSICSKTKHSYKFLICCWQNEEQFQYLLWSFFFFISNFFFLLFFFISEQLLQICQFSKSVRILEPTIRRSKLFSP